MTLSRRKFLTIAAGGAASAARRRCCCDRRWRPRTTDCSLRCAPVRALGSDVSITALHADERIAHAAIDDAFAELETVESVMSIYRPESQLSRLNRDRVLNSPHPYFIEVLNVARETSIASDGAFDITVQPLWKFFAEAQRAKQLPSDQQIAAAQQRIDWQRVEFDADQILLSGEQTAITLNGIAQGFATDRASAALKKHGVERALINTGEIGALGDKAGGEPWRVGIQHPRLADAYISLARLEGRSLATSGDYATSFSADLRANHIFDPRTGRSPTELASVSIAAESATIADALSTAVFVLGPNAGAELVRKFNADAFFVLKNGRTLATDNFPLDA